MVVMGILAGENMVSKLTNKQFIKKCFEKKPIANDVGLTIFAELLRRYKKLHKLSKNYVTEDSIENARKLQKELEIEPWW